MRYYKSGPVKWPARVVASASVYDHDIGSTGWRVSRLLKDDSEGATIADDYGDVDPTAEAIREWFKIPASTEIVIGRRTP